MWLILGKWRGSLFRTITRERWLKAKMTTNPKGFCTSVHTLGVSAGPERVKTHLKWMVASTKLSKYGYFPYNDLNVMHKNVVTYPYKKFDEQEIMLHTYARLLGSGHICDAKAYWADALYGALKIMDPPDQTLIDRIGSSLQRSFGDEMPVVGPRTSRYSLSYKKQTGPNHADAVLPRQQGCLPLSGSRPLLDREKYRERVAADQLGDFVVRKQETTMDGQRASVLSPSKWHE
jgi:hypothetical protein